jgi:hypothetical protein
VINPLFWLVFPFACVALVFVLVFLTRIPRWLRAGREWREFLRDTRSERDAWEREEEELLDEHVD